MSDVAAPLDPAALPDDAAALKAMLVAERGVRLDLAEEVARLTAIVDAVKRAMFGRRSEKLGPGQLELALEDAEQEIAEDRAEQDADDAALKRTRGQRRRANRGALPKHLPRVEKVFEPESLDCPCCGGELHRIGEDGEPLVAMRSRPMANERLDVLPAQFRVLVTRRPKYACRGCTDGVVQVPAPARLILGGLPTEAMVAQVLVGKYADHLPLYRQAQIFARQGWRSTARRWPTGSAMRHANSAPSMPRLVEILKASPRLFVDETRAPVLDPGRGRTKTGWLRALARDDRPWGGSDPPGVAFLYAEGRGAEHASRHLDGFRGTLQVDGYAAYRGLTDPRRAGGSSTTSPRPAMRRSPRRRCAGSLAEAMLDGEPLARHWSERQWRTR